MEPRDHELMLFVTPTHDCSYLEGLEARDRILHPPSRIDGHIYTQLARVGFRRNGSWLYQPRCPGCRACESTRIPVDEFRPSRSQQRCLRRNADLLWTMVAPRITEEQHALYRRYQQQRHLGGPMAEMGADACETFLTAPWGGSQYLEFRDDGRLIMVAALDLLGDAVSSVYTFFDPDLDPRGLGNLAILTSLELARDLGKRWVYLGYHIAESPKMAYKARFRPMEFYRDGLWTREPREPGPATPLT